MSGQAKPAIEPGLRAAHWMGGMTGLLRWAALGWVLAAFIVPLACADARGSGAPKQDFGGYALAGVEGRAPELAAPRQALRIAGSRPVTLDPALVRDAGSAQYVVELFSGLVKLDSNLQVTGDLARGWEVLDEGRTYRFHLRPGLRFGDGKRLGAEDVRFSLTRALSAELGSKTALTYLGDIKGAAELAAGTAQQLAGLLLLQPDVVELQLLRPVPYFLSKLTYPVSYVVDRGQTSQKDWFTKPNSSGPFKLQRWRVGQEIVLARNDLYHTPPRLESVEIALIGGSEALLRYETGRLDIVGIGGGDVDRFRDSSDPLSGHYRSVPQFSLYYLGFNSQVPPFDDVHVRRAFAMAVDVDKIVRVSLRGQSVPANGVLPEGFPGYDSSRERLPYDPAAARAELRKSSYGSSANLPEITLLSPETGFLLPSYLEAALYLLQENLGVEVSVRAVEWADFLDELYNPQNPFQMFTLGWSADYPDPHNFMDLMFHSESAENIFHYSNPAVDGLLERARTLQPPAERIVVYQETEAIVIDEAPLLPFWFAVDHLLIRPNVRDFLSPVSTQEWMSRVWIAA